MGVALSTFIVSPISNFKVYGLTDETFITSDPTQIDGGVDFSTPLYLMEEEVINKAQAISTQSDSKEITIPFETQKTNYYCGPAAAQIVLGGIGYSVTQEYMAGLLGTTTNGTTAGNNVANALNQVVSGSKFQFLWEWHTAGNIATIRSHIVEAINYGNPVMVNTAEGPGDVYLAGHDIGSALYHYGVVADYFNNGNTVTYTDPGYGRFVGFVMDQRVSINDLSNATGTRGYAW